MLSPLFTRIIEGHSFEFRLQTETAQDANFDVGSSKIVEQLRLVCAVKGATPFKLQ